MDRPVQLVVLLIGLSVPSSHGMSSAEQPPSGSTRERAISPRVAEMLSVVAPKFETSASASDQTNLVMPGQAARGRVPGPAISTPANTIIRLPEYLVRERKPRPLPKPEDVLVPRELEKLALREFLGPEDGLDRGFLNVFTLADLWKKFLFWAAFPLASRPTQNARCTCIARIETPRHGPRR